MKLLILKDKLRDGIGIVERISTKSLSLPILENILIKTEGNFINLTTTNLEIGINWWSLVKVEKEGKITTLAKPLSNFINLLPNKPVLLELKDSFLNIECNNYKARLKSADTENFPIIPKIESSESISINSNTFCQSLSQVVDIPTFSTARPEISGIYLLFEKNSIKITGTDSFRLGEKTIFLDSDFPNAHFKNYSIILPQRTAKEIINIFGEKKGDIKIFFSQNQIQFEFPMIETTHPQIQLMSKLVEGEYPNYQDIIPKKYKTKVILPKNEFLNQIKSASLFSGKISEVKFKINPKKNEVEFYSQNPDLGEYQSFLLGKIEGEGVEVSFNYRFLIDGLLNIKSPEVTLEFNGEDGPVVLKPIGDSTYIYVVMPIKAS